MGCEHINRLLISESPRISKGVELAWRARYPELAGSEITHRIADYLQGDGSRIPSITEKRPPVDFERNTVKSDPIYLMDLAPGDNQGRRRNAILDYALDGMAQDFIRKLRFALRMSTVRLVPGEHFPVVDSRPEQPWIPLWDNLWAYPGWMTRFHHHESAFGEWCWVNIPDRLNNPDGTLGYFTGSLEYEFKLDIAKLVSSRF